MPDPVTGTIAAVGGVASGIGASKTASAQKSAAQSDLQLQREIFQEQKELLEPFRALGVGTGLPGLQQLATPQGQATFYDQYFQSPQFSALANQARGQQLAAAEATGSLGATSTSNQLARIAPELGTQALQQQQNLLGQLTNIGLQGAGAQAGFASQYGAAGGQAIRDIGAARAGQAAIPYQLAGQALSGLGAYQQTVPGGLF